MTSARQNVLEMKSDRRRAALHFEVVWSRKGKRNPIAGSARRKREPARSEGLTFPVLVDSETPDLRFKRLPRNSEFCSRARRSGDTAMALSKSSFDQLYFAIGQRRNPF